MKQKRIPMQHPTKRDENGKPVVQQINARTVASGKAAKLGYTPVPQPEQPPVFKQSTEPIEVQDTEFIETPESITTPKPKITKAPKTKA